MSILLVVWESHTFVQDFFALTSWSVTYCLCSNSLWICDVINIKILKWFLQRARLFCSIDEGKWENHGIGHVTIDYIKVWSVCSCILLLTVMVKFSLCSNTIFYFRYHAMLQIWAFTLVSGFNFFIYNLFLILHVLLDHILLAWWHDHHSTFSCLQKCPY